MIPKKRGGPPGSGMTVRVVTLSEKAAGEVRRRSALLGPRQRKDEASRTASEIIERLADGRLVCIDPSCEIAIRVTPETAALAQRLMLHFPHIPTVESLFEYALVKLAETTDD